MITKRPGGELATRPLHFIWICDCSGSMAVDAKIQSLNTAIREAIPHMQGVADENPNAGGVGARPQVFQRRAVAYFSADPGGGFQMGRLDGGRRTDMGKALTMWPNNSPCRP